MHRAGDGDACAPGQRRPGGRGATGSEAPGPRRLRVPAALRRGHVRSPSRCSSSCSARARDRRCSSGSPSRRADAGARQGCSSSARAVYGFVRNGIVGDVIGAEGAQVRPATSTTLFCLHRGAATSSASSRSSSSRRRRKHRLPARPRADRPGCSSTYVGIQRHGFVGYFKAMMFPPGRARRPIYVLLAPIEFFSTFIIRPFTLALRLFANMFAGHLLLLLFTSSAARTCSSGGGVAGALSASRSPGWSASS